MVTHGRIHGGGGGNRDTLTRGAHGEGGGWGHVHVELRGKFQCSKLLHFLLQPPVLHGQILAAPFQKLTVNFRLLQLGPENFSQKKKIS